MRFDNLKDFDSWIMWAIETAAWNTLGAIIYRTAGWEAFAMWVY